MRARGTVDIVRKCENVLGWAANARMSAGRERALQVRRLNKAIAEQPQVTIESLELAIEYLRGKRQPIQSPIYLTYVVSEALAHANLARTDTPAAERIEQAIAKEQQTPHEPRAQYWVGRLTRASGAGREIALTEWRAERGAR